MFHRAVLQATAAAIVLFAAGCGPELEPSTAGSPVPAVAESASPSISTDAADEAGRSIDEEAEDRPAATGECAAYVDSDDWCTDGIGDYDCEDGIGNGPNYAPSDVKVVNPGTDPFGLDNNNDGEGCEGPAPAPAPPAPPPNPGTDPRFDTCAEAIDNGYGPYYRGQDPEYDWYRDADGDGVVCE